MDVPLELTFHHMAPDAGLEALVRRMAARLERFYDHINSCRVALERPENDGAQIGKRYRFRVRVEVGVPGENIVAVRDERDVLPNQKIDAGVREAFHVAERRLKQYVDRLQPTERLKVSPPMGHIVKLNRSEGYGFIQAADGHSVYFHEHAVSGGDFESLCEGQEVHFQEILGDAGPRATQVRPYRKHGEAGLEAP